MKRFIPGIVILAAALFFIGCPNPSVDLNLAETYSITYLGNGNTKGEVPVDPKRYAKNAKVTIFQNTGSLAKTNNTFLGWTLSADGTGTLYTSGQIFTITENTKLYAKWITINRIFRAQDLTTKSWYDCPAHLMATGSQCIVYAETTAGMTTATANNIAAEFDANIYTTITDTFGEESDVDDNGKIILLFLDIRDGYIKEGGYVAGYFDSTHLFSTASFANSNQSDMIFLDTNPAKAGGAESYQTIAHEFQHLINFATTFSDDQTVQDLWINEGLSSAAEYVYQGSQIQWKIDYFNADPVETIINGNNFFVWNGYWESTAGGGDILADYATVYLFFQWLRIQASNGNGIYKEILSSSYRDYRAVTAAASNSIDLRFAVWSEVLGTWMMANLLNHATDFRGYKGKIAAGIGYYLSSENFKYQLAPGEGIFSLMPPSGENTPPESGANIKYIGLTAAGTEDRESPYTGIASLVYNANPLYTEADETGYIASYGLPLTRSNSSIFPSIVPAQPLRKSYPIDVQLATGGGLKADSHTIQKRRLPKIKGAKK